MARLTSIAKAGYYPTPFGLKNPQRPEMDPDLGGDTSIIDAIARLIAPSNNPEAKLLDLTAGCGHALVYLSQQWSMQPWGAELDTYRYNKLLEHKGIDPRRMIAGDSLTARIQSSGFQVIYNNPPYYEDIHTADLTDKDDNETSRLEYKFLVHGNQKLQKGGVHMWVVYAQHITRTAARYLAQNFGEMRIFRIPRLHMGSYMQIVVVGYKDAATTPQTALANEIYQRAVQNHRWAIETRNSIKSVFAVGDADTGDADFLFDNLMLNTGPFYQVPEPRQINNFYFVPHIVRKEALLHSAQLVGGHLNDKFAPYVSVKEPQPSVRPLVLPRISQMAGLIASGLVDGIVITSEAHGKGLVRSQNRHVEIVVDTEEKYDAEGNATGTSEKRQIVPQTVISVLWEDGSYEKVAGDEEFGVFVSTYAEQIVQYVNDHFQPQYNFDYIGGRLGKVDEDGRTTGIIADIVLKNEHSPHGSPMFPAQRHVVSAMVERLEREKAVILAGEPGVGKTLMGAALMLLTKYRFPGDPWYDALVRQKPAASRIKPGQFNIVTAPSHLVSKWSEEILGIDATAHVGLIMSDTGNPLESALAFIRDIPNWPADTLHVLVMSKDMMKLGETWSAAIQTKAVGKNPKTGKVVYVPKCPTSGRVVRTKANPKEGDPANYPVNIESDRFGATWRSAPDIERKKLIGVKTAETNVNPIAYTIGDYEERAERAREYAEDMKSGRWTYGKLQAETRSADSLFFHYMASENAEMRKLREKRDAYLMRPQCQLWQEDRYGSHISASIGHRRSVGHLLAEAIRAEKTSYVMPLPDLLEQYQPEISEIIETQGERKWYHPRRNPRGPLAGVASFIAERFKDQIYMVIFDELHEYKESSAQGLAMTRLANAARRVVGMTGTLYGGVASSLFQIEFIFNPYVQKVYGYSEAGLKAWVERMGILEYTVSENESSKKDARSSDSRSRSEMREVPGASPELLRVLVDHTIFLEMLDLGKVMPPLRHEIIPIQLDDTMADIYRDAQSNLLSYLMNEGGKSFMSEYLYAMIGWPNTPHQPYEVWHTVNVRDEETGKWTKQSSLIYTIPSLPEDYITPKEQYLIDAVTAEIEKGRGVCIYVSQSGKRDVQDRLVKIIEDNVPLAKAAILRASVKPTKRKEWLNKQKANVLICNARLVKTGLDLLQYPTLIWYEVNYSLYTMDQASGRAWRAIQTKACDVLYPFYFMESEMVADTMEAMAVALVRRKSGAAAFLYGRSGGGSLSSLTKGSGSLIAQLTQTIEKGVQIDLSTLYGTAARESVESDWETHEVDNREWSENHPIISDEDDDVVAEPIIVPEPEPVAIPAPVQRVVEVSQPKPVQKSTKPIQQKQMSLFDWIAVDDMDTSSW